jgi:hypothetical protein
MVLTAAADGGGSIKESGESKITDMRPAPPMLPAPSSAQAWEASLGLFILHRACQRCIIEGIVLIAAARSVRRREQKK